MTRDEALKQLADAEVVPCISAGIADIKEVFEACLAAEIPAVLDRQDDCGGHGHGHACATKIDLCVRPDDLPKIMAIMQSRWQNLLEREGTLEPAGEAGAAEEEQPCPACGAPGPLVDGACKDCGLQLE